MQALEITATANVKPLVTGLEEVRVEVGKTIVESTKLTTAFGTLSKEVTRIPAPFANTQKGIDAFAASLNKIPGAVAPIAPALSKIPAALSKIGPGANQATNAMTNFGRVIQDAPFGIIGITNNINPLLESFQRLKAETGSTGGALKALGTSMIGAGGLGLAVSVITSLLTVFALASRGAGGSAEDLSGNISALKVDFDNAKEALDAFNASTNALKSLRDINLKLNISNDLERLDVASRFDLGDAKRQLNELIKLVDVAEERSGSTFALIFTKGSAALQDLISKYGNLDTVKKNSNDLSSKDVQLLDAAISASKDLLKVQNDVKIQRTKIQEVGAKTLLDVKELNDKEKERVKNILTISKVLEQLRLELSFLSAKELTFKTDETKAKISEINKAIETLVTKLKVSPDSKLITRLFGNIQDLQLPLLFKEIADSARKARLEIPVFFNQEQLAEELGAAIKGAVSKGGTAIGKDSDLELKIPVSFSESDLEGFRQGLITKLASQRISTVDRVLDNGLKIKIPVQIATTTELQAQLDSLKAKLAAFQAEATAAVQETMMNIGTEIGNSLGTFLGELAAGNEDAIPNLFGNLMSGIGGQIKELGKFLVKAGIEMAFAKKAIKLLKLTPQTAIIAGIALQALGTLLQAQANKKLQGFASGTRGVQEGGFYNVGERGMETVFLPRGTSVQPNNEMNAYGGGQMIFIPSVTLQGPDLVIAFNRAQQQMGRNN